MNVKQKRKKKRKKAWKRKIANTRLKAANLNYTLVNKNMWVPGSDPTRCGMGLNFGENYYLINHHSATAVMYLYDIITEGTILEINDYLDRLWKLKVFF